MYADLHIHSCYSDGMLTPAEIIRICEECKIRTIAITDHDSISSIKETIQLAQDKIDVVPAVEMSSNLGDLDIHILGYYIDYKNADLIDYFENYRQHRLERAEKIVEKLSRAGVKLDFARIKGIGNDVALGRPHIAGALLANGYVNSIGEAFIRFLGYHSAYYVPKKSIHTEEAIKKIKEWKGIPVVAHPGIINSEEVIHQLISYGVYGLEVWHPEHNKRAQDNFFEMAMKNGLLMTGGSDFHGFRNKFGLIGKIGCGHKEVLRLKRMKVE